MSSIAFVVTSAHPAASPYFTLFPKEPIPKASGEFVTVEKVIGLKDQQLTTLLEAIVRNVKADGSALIVTHGNDVGLFIDIGPSKLRISLQAAVLRSIRSGLEGRTDDAEMVKLLKLDQPRGDKTIDRLQPVARWTHLKGLIQKVQALKMKRVDLRSCNTGKQADVLSLLQEFFGCAVCCAPKIYDTYGSIDVEFLKNPQDPNAEWQKWVKEHPGATVQGEPGRRFGLHYTIIDGTKVRLTAKVDNAAAAIAWMKLNLPPGNTDSYKSGLIYYHGLTDLKSITFAGDPRYRDYLVEANQGVAPPKIDPMKAPLDP